MRILRTVYCVSMFIVMSLAAVAIAVILLMAAWGVLAHAIGIPAAIVMPIVIFFVYMASKEKSK